MANPAGLAPALDRLTGGSIVLFQLRAQIQVSCVNFSVTSTAQQNALVNLCFDLIPASSEAVSANPKVFTLGIKMVKVERRDALIVPTGDTATTLIFHRHLLQLLSSPIDSFRPALRAFARCARWRLRVFRSVSCANSHACY